MAKRDLLYGQKRPTIRDLRKGKEAIWPSMAQPSAPPPHTSTAHAEQTEQTEQTEERGTAHPNILENILY